MNSKECGQEKYFLIFNQMYIAEGYAIKNHNWSTSKNPMFLTLPELEQSIILMARLGLYTEAAW